MIKKILFVLCFLFFIFSTATAADKSKILILYYKTDYKELIKNKLLEKFDKATTEITVAELKQWKEHPASNYDVVILMSGVAAGNPYKKGANYIKQNNYSKNIIYFSSSKQVKSAYGSKIDKSKIDVITSASKTAEAGATVEKIYSKAQELLP